MEAVKISFSTAFPFPKGGWLGGKALWTSDNLSRLCKRVQKPWPVPTLWRDWHDFFPNRFLITGCAWGFTQYCFLGVSTSAVVQAANSEDLPEIDSYS